MVMEIFSMKRFLQLLMKIPPVQLILWLLLFPFYPEMEIPKYFVFQVLLTMFLAVYLSTWATIYVLHKWPQLLL